MQAEQEPGRRNGEPIRRRKLSSDLRLGGVLVALGLTSCNLPTSGQEPRASLEEARAVALLVGISDYSDRASWPALNADRDLRLVSDALESHGVHILARLENRKATRAAILGALAGLRDAAPPGGTAVFHFSGHGVRVSDDNGDEPDGYDEALAAFDARQHQGIATAASGLLRDDELSSALVSVRRKLGPDGEMLVVFDSCFSGSASKSGQRARGMPLPIGPPRIERSGDSTREPEEGLGELQGADGSVGLAPLIVLAAAGFNELAYEMDDPEGKPVGALSYAFAVGLNSSNSETSYFDLQAILQNTMYGRVPNVPRASGPLARRILGGGAVDQSPFHSISKVSDGGRSAVIDAGVFSGVFAGSEIGFYPAGTRSPSGTAQIGSGVVRDANPYSSVVAVATGAQVLEERRDEVWAFVLSNSSQYLRSTIRVDSGVAAEILDEFVGDGLVQIVQSGEDAVLRKEAGSEALLLARPDGSVLWMGAMPPQPDALIALRAKLEDLAYGGILLRNRLGRDRATEIRVHSCELELSSNVFGDSTASCEPSTEPERSDQDAWTLRLGEGYRVSLTNRGRGAYVYLLHVAADAKVSLLWPGRNEVSMEDNFLSRRARFLVPFVFRAAEPIGTDWLVAVATERPVDIRAFTTASRTGGLSKGIDRIEVERSVAITATPILVRE